MRSFSAAGVPLKVWAAAAIIGLWATAAFAGYLPLLHAGLGAGGGAPAGNFLIQLGGLGYITQLDGSKIIWTP
jgi:hypothetical protein